MKQPLYSSIINFYEKSIKTKTGNSVVFQYRSSFIFGNTDQALNFGERAKYLTCRPTSYDENSTTLWEVSEPDIEPLAFQLVYSRSDQDSAVEVPLSKLVCFELVKSHPHPLKEGLTQLLSNIEEKITFHKTSNSFEEQPNNCSQKTAN